MKKYYLSGTEIGKLRQIIRGNRNHFRKGFIQYLEEHPDIFEGFAIKTFMVRSRGFTRYSAKTIIETLRWHTDISEGPTSTFKIRAIYVADLSRLAMLRWPELAGFFNTARTPLRSSWKRKEVEIMEARV